MTKTVCITGATGMIGLSLTKDCISNGIDVIAIVRNSSVKTNSLPESPRLKILFSDISELDAIDTENMKADVFYHLAWTGTSKRDRFDNIVQASNIQYTLKAVKLASEMGCKKFIGAGSQAEYGYVQDIIDSRTIPNPVTPYGIAKMASGMMSRNMCDTLGIVHIWPRIFSVYGPMDKDSTMISQVVNKALMNEEIVIDHGSRPWDYLYESDAGHMLYLMGQIVESSRSYRVAFGESRPLKEYVSQIITETGSSSKISFESNDSQYGLNVDAQDLFEDIGYRPQVSFKEGIQRIIASRRMFDE